MKLKGDAHSEMRAVKQMVAKLHGDNREKTLPVFPVGHPGKNMYVPWVLRIAHKSLTLGHPAGRLPLTGGVTSQKENVYVPFSFSEIKLPPSVG